MSGLLVKFNFIIVSIPGSGTRFCEQFMNLLGFETDETLSRKHVGVGRDLTTAGMVPADTRIIFPQRDPIKTYHTLHQRISHTNTTNHRVIRVTDPLESMIAGYEQIKRFRSTHTTITLPVDIKPMPGNFWVDFPIFLNLPYKSFSDPRVLRHIHEWYPVGSKPHEFPYHDVPKEIIAMRKEMGYKNES